MNQYTARPLIRWAAAALFAMLCSGCTNVASFGSDGLYKLLPDVKTIGLIITPEPEIYENRPRSLSPFTRDLLDEFGGIIGRGIYTARDLKKADTGGQALTSALRLLRPQVSYTLLERMEQNLAKRGYTVKYLPPPGRTAVGFDVSGPQSPAVDALVEILVSPGYEPDERQSYHFPFVVAAINVYDGKGTQVAVRTIAYQGAVTTSDPHQIAVSGKYALRNEQAVIDNPSLVLEAFYDGARRIADLAAQDF